MSDEAPTQPTLKSIMDAINDVGVELQQFRKSVEDRLGKLETNVGLLNSEVQAMGRLVALGFEDIEAQMEVLAGDVVRARARSKRLAVKPPIDEASEGEPGKKRA